MNGNRFQIVSPPQPPAEFPRRDVGARPGSPPAPRRPSYTAVLLAIGLASFGLSAAALFYLALELWP